VNLGMSCARVCVYWRKGCGILYRYILH